MTLPQPQATTSNICLEKTRDPQSKDTEGTCAALFIILAKDPHPAALAAPTALTYDLGLPPHPELPLPSRSPLARAALN